MSKPSHASTIKAMCLIAGRPDPFPEVHLPVKRSVRKDKGVKRGTQPEAVLRKAIVKELRRRGFQVWRIEPSFRGKWGVADLWFFSLRAAGGGWIEVKTPTGTLNDDQIEFERLCFENRIFYQVLTSVEDIKTYLG